MLVVAIFAHFLSQIEPKELVIHVEEFIVVVPDIDRRDIECSWPMDVEDYVGLSSPFGERDLDDTGGYGDDYHDALDLFGVWLARIRCAFPGIAVCVFPAPNGYFRGHPVFGGFVAIKSIFRGEVYIFVYGHMADVEVREGDQVDLLAYLGRQGNTGRSNGAHLHFGINRGGSINIDTGDITGGTWLNPLMHMKEPV